MLFGHALTSSALFFGIGLLYERYKTRLLFYYGGLSTFMPVFSFFYLFLFYLILLFLLQLILLVSFNWCRWIFC